MKLRFIQKDAPGAVAAAVYLCLLAAGFAVLGAIGTIITSAVNGSLALPLAVTNSLLPLPSLRDRPTALTAATLIASTLVLVGLLLLSAMRLGRRRPHALLLMTLTCVLMVGGNYTIGFMIGTSPLMMCLVATIVAWSPPSRQFLN